MGQLMLVREGEVRGVILTRLGRGVDFEKTLKVADDPSVPVRQRRRVVTCTWKPDWFDLRLTRLRATPKETVDKERGRWKLEYERGEELLTASEGGIHGDDCKMVKIVVPV